jgi:hypothetical protein
MLRLLTKRFSWLDPAHPIAAREAKFNPVPLPKFILKLTDFWALLGYAALLHGLLFLISLLSYSRISRAFPNMMLPFLTPFGTPVSAGMIHSLLYWAMIIGICNYTVYFVARDVEMGAWTTLRMTPYRTHEILLAKLVSVARIWWRVLRVLLITRLLALALIPVSTVIQRSTDTYTGLGLDLLGALIFLAQPLVDGFLAASLSLVSAFTIRGMMWSKMGAYAMYGVISGALSRVSGVWLIFLSPIGMLGGLLVPLSHWAPLISAVTASGKPNEMVIRTLFLFVAYILLPLLIGIGAFVLAIRKARTSY